MYRVTLSNGNQMPVSSLDTLIELVSAGVVSADSELLEISTGRRYRAAAYSPIAYLFPQAPTYPQAQAQAPFPQPRATKMLHPWAVSAMWVQTALALLLGIVGQAGLGLVFNLVSFVVALILAFSRNRVERLNGIIRLVLEVAAWLLPRVIGSLTGS